MAFWQAVSSKARVLEERLAARKTTRDEDGREAITRRSCGSNPSRLRARSPYGSKVPKGTLFTTVRSFRSASLLRNQTKEKQPIGLFFLLSGYENDERGSLCQRSRKAIGMAFWQAVSSKARVLEERLAARKTTRDEDGREAITRRSCGSNPSRLRARSPYGSKVPKGTLFTTVWLRNHIVKPKKISWLRSPKISRFFVFSRFLAGINHFAVYLMGRLISNTAPPSFAACIVPL